MGEMDEAVAGMRDAGVLEGMRWAYLSATGRVLDDYAEATGHDPAWLGITRFVLYRDRLDRVFSCGRYAVPMDSTAEAGRDVLHAELTADDVRTMPDLDPELVSRADLNGSPGWSWGPWRWLLASAAVGGILDLHWAQTSATKQQIARRVELDPAQGSLFDLHELDGVAGPEGLQRADDLETLVIAHAQDTVRLTVEAVLGRPRFNAGGGSAWHWNYNVLSTPPSDNRGTRLDPAPVVPPSVPDAPVRLRQPVAGTAGLRAADDR